MIKRNPQYDCEVIVKVKILSMINDDELFDEFGGSAMRCAQNLINEDGLLGVCEDNFEVLAATLTVCEE